MMRKCDDYEIAETWLFLDIATDECRHTGA